MKKTEHSTRVKKWIPAFIAALSIEPNVTVAAESAHISPVYVYQVHAKDEAFRKQWDAALEAGADRMESEAYRRAVNGTLRPVYQGGARVGFVREYSDTLMCLLLKAHKPKKYRENSSVEMTGPDGTLVSPVHIYIPSNGKE